MKKLMVTFQLIAISATAQITFEASYPNAPGYSNSGLIQLSAAGYKYFENVNGQINIYNLNHSLFRTFSIPPQPFTPISNIGVRFVSDELFNTNSADIEYMIVYRDTTNFGIGPSHIRVYDELGNVLFLRDTADCPNSTNSFPMAQHGIVFTSAGVKMLIRDMSPSGAMEVYSLPGTIPCNECTGGVINGIQQTGGGTQPNQQLPAPYPNPTTSSVTIPYQLPAGTNSGTMIIYDLLGQEVKQYSVTSSFNTLVIESGTFLPGTYTYVLSTAQGNVAGNKIVVSE